MSGFRAFLAADPARTSAALVVTFTVFWALTIGTLVASLDWHQAPTPCHRASWLEAPQHAERAFAKLETTEDHP